MIHPGLELPMSERAIQDLARLTYAQKVYVKVYRKFLVYVKVYRKFLLNGMQKQGAIVITHTIAIS